MAIQQHPLPQDISSYRFRLIGDMTIKQFASLGICAVVGVVVYGLPLPFFFRYPLAFIFVALGVGMAFVPVQGRSLDIWIIAFIKSIYSPTQYTWKKAAAGTQSEDTIAPSAANSQTLAPVSTTAGIEVDLTRGKTTPVISAPQQQIVSPVISSPVVPPQTSNPSVSSAPVTPAVHTPISIPETPSISITPTASTPPVVPTTAPVASIPNTPVIPAQPSSPAPTTNLPIPFTPTTINTLVGLTLTPDGKILDGVLVEIKKDNLTLRATKSNKLGQFMFARPLENGLYQILAEKESFHFSPYSLNLTGEIIRPLKIQAQ